MLKFEWNALRVGHRVVVHDPSDSTMALVPGVVAMVDMHVARRGVSGVGIRVVDGDGSSRVLWPSYLAVHSELLDPDEPCWRCEELRNTSTVISSGGVEPSVVRELEGPPPPRMCGRCRVIFGGDTTLPLDLDTGWWACDPCRELLIGPGALAVPTWPAKPLLVASGR